MVLKLGDFVWAKLKSFSPWPAMVVVPDERVKCPKSRNKKVVFQYVFFFGTRNFSWVEEKNIKDYELYKDVFRNVSKATKFREGCVEIEEYKSKRLAGELSTFEDYPSFISDMDSFLISNSSTVKTSSPIESPAADSTTAKEVAVNVVKPSNSRKRKANPVAKAKVSEYVESPSSSSYGPSPPNKKQRPLPPPLVNISIINQIQRDRNIVPSKLRIGFLGIGKMGSCMVNNLQKSGHKIMIWNRSMEKCKPFLGGGRGIKRGSTPSEVIRGSDIIIGCFTDSAAVRDVLYSPEGILGAMDQTKAYIEMSSIDPECSRDSAEIIGSKGGRYLEAQILGSRKDAEDGTLVILTAGEQSVYYDCVKNVFEAIAKNTFYLDAEVGRATEMSLIFQMMIGGMSVVLTEGMALAEKANLDHRSVMDILRVSSLACPFTLERGQLSAEDGQELPQLELIEKMQKGLSTALIFSNQLSQPLPMAANANEILKQAKFQRYEISKSASGKGG